MPAPFLLRPAVLARLRIAAGWLTGVLPGCGLSVVVALAASFVAMLHGGPQFLYALLFGICFNHLGHEPRSMNGIEFSARTLLRLGVGLLGARVTAAQVAGLGWDTVIVVVGGVATTIGLAMLLGRWLGMTRPQCVLSGGAVAICGASAALALSAILPREKEGDRFTVMVVVSVTVFSTLAMIFYPLIARAVHLPPDLAGLFIGGAIHDVAQVVGAGYTLGRQAGDTATIVKLFRVSLLTVLVVLVATAFRRSREQAERARPERAASAKQPLVPGFLWLFITMVGLNSSGALPASVLGALDNLSRGCLLTAIAALGMKTSFKQLAATGWCPLLLILAETVWLAVLVLASALLMR